MLRLKIPSLARRHPTTTLVVSLFALLDNYCTHLLPVTPWAVSIVYFLHLHYLPFPASVVTALDLLSTSLYFRPRRYYLRLLSSSLSVTVSARLLRLRSVCSHVLRVCGFLAPGSHI